jgi:hypothetical protein
MLQVLSSSKITRSLSNSRQFLTVNYSKIKSMHPSLPILIRESQSVERPIAYTRWPLGVESNASLDGLDVKELESIFGTLLKK